MVFLFYYVKYINAGDRRLVTKYGKEAAWFGFSKKPATG
jgi:hypothetical protein